jgi:hypothetical protein
MESVTSHSPPPGLHDGCRVALKIADRWRQGTVLEMRSSPVLFRVRYDESLPTGAWTSVHGPNHDKLPVALRILDETAHDSEPCAFELLGGGVTLLRKALAEDEQEALVQDCLRCLPLQKANGSKLDEKPTPGFVWCFGYDNASDLSLQRPACLATAARLLEQLGHQRRRTQLREADRRESNSKLHLAPLPGNLSFHRLWARLYAGPSALGWHRDPDCGLKAWVCNINLGADATFAWRHQGKTHRVRLTSGDAIFFNGGQEGLEHAVEEVHETACPAFWAEAWRSAQRVSRHGGLATGTGVTVGISNDSAAPPFVRVGLQMRM